MPSSLSLLLALAVLALASAGCRRAGPPVVQAVAASFTKELEEGLTDQIDIAHFPRGIVQFAGPDAPRREGQAAAMPRYPEHYLPFLQRAERDGFLALSEKTPSPEQEQSSRAARVFEVQPTERLLKLRDGAKSTSNLIAIPNGSIHVLQVQRDDLYRSSEDLGTPGEELRRIQGRARDTPSPQALSMGPLYCTVEPQEIKFRALLKYRLFSKTYRYVIADVGNPNDGEWKSQNVR